METTKDNTVTPENNKLQQALTAHRTQQSAEQKLRKPAPHILIVGKSASGKSRSIKTLPEKQTVVINIEDKTLPFQDAKRFDENMASGFDYAIQIDKLLIALKDNPDIKYIVIDSLTKYFEMLMIESKKQGGGYEIFNRYNTAIYNLLEACKKITNKIIIFIGIDELIKDEQPSGALTNKRTLWVEGKVHAGKIEKEFSVVLYTDVKVQPGPAPVISYNFITQTDGVTSAKSPEGLFERTIPNDLGLVVSKVEQYFGLGNK